ncbi:two component transcriptional regulator, LytTR family [Flavobacterium sp. CF108]|uniref:LytR/AlgR family response regulator transcription factor n=1 Tax=unclassified Flavobacterium TaxID=196869 RepID=UPI0008D54A68|nr:MULTISPECIES: LytTR family DNA-binding domain-containing protein [unclassified Flavobacterium]SEO21238.1 two component transcriptional regulator, LytTR family [Flavobacterium sp. fv08]SHG51826.1 two component transcriptional regulator, LytTR family [Flavobacterium sp. CF108]
MITVLIIEDEAANAIRLQKMLLQSEEEIVILGVLQTVRDSIEWLEKESSPDIIFMDIRLTDGLSFEIFNQVSIKSYVIFTTAYDEYALQAFEVNGIDYLLKPIEQKKLDSSVKRIKRFMAPQLDISVIDILKKMRLQKDIYRSRFLISYKDLFITIPSTDVAYFTSENKIVHLTTHTGQRYVIRQTLDELVQELNPEDFFKVTRNYIVCLKAIQKLSQSFDYKLKLELNPPVNEIILVSRERGISFKNWLNSK